MMSTVGMISGSFATIFSFCGGKKWMTRLGRNGISRSGSGAPTASGLKKSLGLRTRCKGTARDGRAPSGIRFDALLFDAGGVFVLPDPTVLGPLLAYYGGDPSIERARARPLRAAWRRRAQPAAARRSGTSTTSPTSTSVGVPAHDVEAAAASLGRHRNAWTVAVAASPRTSQRCARCTTPACRSASCRTPAARSRSCSGAAACARSATGDARPGAGDHRQPRRRRRQARPARSSSTRCTSSTASTAARIAYVGDSVTMDVGGARAAGLHPILLDPYDDHPDADFDRIRSLARPAAGVS